APASWAYMGKVGSSDVKLSQNNRTDANNKAKVFWVSGLSCRRVLKEFTKYGGGEDDLNFLNNSVLHFKRNALIIERLGQLPGVQSNSLGSKIDRLGQLDWGQVGKF
ncbi:MAG: hypothetical protein RLZZ490_519, partial [Cyanobacteriota bacterium]